MANLIAVCRKLKRSLVQSLNPFDFNQTPKTQREILSFIQKVPITWYQSIDLPHGLKTPGRDSKQKFELARILEQIKDSAVLDIGCNTGALSFLAAEAGAREVYAIDKDEDLIRTGRVINRIKNLRIHFENMDAFSALPCLGSKHFDYCFAFAVFHKVTRSENQWGILTDPQYAKDLQKQERLLRDIIQMTRKTLFLELTYRFKGYPRAKENYPLREEIDPALFVRQYSNPSFFSKIELLGQVTPLEKSSELGGKLRVVYQCHIR